MSGGWATAVSFVPVRSARCPLVALGVSERCAGGLEESRVHQRQREPRDVGDRKRKHGKRGGSARRGRGRHKTEWERRDRGGKEEEERNEHESEREGQPRTGASRETGDLYWNGDDVRGGTKDERWNGTSV